MRRVSGGRTGRSDSFESLLADAQQTRARRKSRQPEGFMQHQVVESLDKEARRDSHMQRGHSWKEGMLIRVKRGQRGTESPEERGKPEELSGDAFQEMRRAALGG